MTNENTINVNMNNLSTEERTQLLFLIKKANTSQQKSNLWKPDIDERYWFIDETGLIDCYRYKADNEDRRAFAIGNYFRTKEEAEFMVERLKVLQELRELANGYKFEHKKANYYMAYDCSTQIIEISACYYLLTNDICFNTKEDIENAINTIGEERLKKYYFCIED